MKNLVKIVARSTWLIALFSMLFACEEHVDPQPPNTQSPDQIVSVGQAKQMFDSYSKRRVPTIKRYEETMVDSTKEFHPTRFGEYDYETMKNYMAFIESEAALAKVSIGGLRFYLTNYPNASKFDDGEPVKYPRQNSFIIVPTTEIDGVQHGFITRATADGGRTIVLIKDWLLENQPDNERGKPQETPKQTGALTKQEGLGSLKPQLLFINPITGAAMPIQVGGEDISLIFNESNLKPPPPDQDTDFD